MGQERALYPEVFFKQSDPTEGFTGFQTMITESIGRTDIDIRRDLLVSVLITGGNCMLSGLSNRIMNVLPDIAPQNVKVKIH
jgi:actin-related protein